MSGPLAIVAALAIAFALLVGYIAGANRHKTCLSGQSGGVLVTVCRNGNAGTSIGTL